MSEELLIHEFVETLAISGACAVLSDSIAQALEINLAKRATLYHTELVEKHNELHRKADGTVPIMHPYGPVPEVPTYSSTRTIRFGSVGLFWAGTTSWLRYKFLLVYFPPAADVETAVLKAFINQVCFGTIFIAGMYFIDNTIRTGEWRDGWHKTKAELWWTQMVNLATKIPINTVVFLYITSVPMQVVALRGYDVLYFIYLSHVSSRTNVEHLLQRNRPKDPGLISEEETQEGGAKSQGGETPSKKPFKCRPCACLQSSWSIFLQTFIPPFCYQSTTRNP